MTFILQSAWIDVLFLHLALDAQYKEIAKTI